jgi:hypothetical protein
MDRLLRDVQLGLVPGRDPAPPLAVPEPSPAAAAEAAVAEPAEAPVQAPVPAMTAPPATEAPQLHVLTELSARLLACVRELLAGYERVLVPSARAQPPARRPSRHRPDSRDVTLAAGPFASLEALREFERAVSHLPGVRDVAVRGYDGADRAIIEVQLDQSNP